MVAFLRFRGLNEDGVPTFINEAGVLTSTDINFKRPSVSTIWFIRVLGADGRRKLATSSSTKVCV